jgi:hypothetical protein
MSIKRRSIPILVLGALTLLSAGLNPVLGQSLQTSAPARARPEGATATYRLDWAAMGEISGGTSASAQYRLNATIGQMGAGTRSASAHYGLCVGFQCAAASAHRVYLPLVFR